MLFRKVTEEKLDLIAAYGLWVLCGTLSLILISFTRATLGSGDTIEHYLIARYAFEMPSLLLDHWGKPLFTACSAPFAIWGFKGIQLFQVINVALTVRLTIQVARYLKLKFLFMVPLIMYGATEYFQSQISGLTELFFALLLSLSFYLWFKNYLVASLVVTSFLPFARSEGMLMIVLWTAFLIINKNWKYVPYLATGNVFYGLLGAIFKNNLFWYFTENPYAIHNPNYGSGKWYHYLLGLLNALGVPNYIFLWLGILWLLIALFHKPYLEKFRYKSFIYFIILGIFVGFITAHTIIWVTNIHVSFGLLRVFNAIMPCLAIIGLIGINGLYLILSEIKLRSPFAIAIKVKELSRGKIKIGFSILLAALVVGFFFSDSPYAPKIAKLLYPARVQIAARETMNFWNNHCPDSLKTRVHFCYDDPQIGLYLSEYIPSFNPFQPNWRGTTWHIKNHQLPRREGYYIWDAWFSVVEGNLSYEEVIRRQDLELLYISPYKDKAIHPIAPLFLLFKLKKEPLQ
ncbi:MAG: hypothetical protein RML72_11380 [Bacteroidia bacterium]|nr:hypothetical protein [Bacteroidia bacterium]MDW8159457.1 hypothetical protein [Bacteroidia bacterium]